MDYQASTRWSKIRVVHYRILLSLIAVLLSLTSKDTLHAQTFVDQMTNVSITAVVLGYPGPVPAPYFPPVTTGPINMVDTKDIAIFRGLAYPGSVVSLLKNGVIVANAPANSDGTFEIHLKNINPGTYSFGISAEDSEHLKSKVTVLTVYLSDGVATLVDGIFIPPTVTSDKIEVKKGESIMFMGRTAPNADMQLSFDTITTHEVLKRATSSFEGIWKYSIDSSLFSVGDHEVKVKAITENDSSLFSEVLSFRVGSVSRLRTKVTELAGFRKRCDLNSDGRVNILDFSIMAFWYKRLGFPARVDLNTDNKINLTDLSILAYCWTG